MVRKHDYDILYLTADIDEFIISQLESQDDKKFRSITAGDLNLSSEEEKKEAEEKSTANRAMFDAMKEALDGKVKDVRVSSRLVSDPVCLTSEGNLSIEMERVLNNVPNNGNHFSAEKILEINASHPIFEKLIRLYTSDPDKLKTYAKLLYDQAMLIAGMPVEDPAAFTQAMCDLMAE
jgi:molecular chaperone HtpG